MKNYTTNNNLTVLTKLWAKKLQRNLKLRDFSDSKTEETNYRVANVLADGEIKSRTLQELSSTLTTFFQTYSTAVFSMSHSLYSTKSVSNTDVHYTAYSSRMTVPFFTQWGLLTIFELKLLHGPLTLNSKTFTHQNRLEKWKNFQEI